jgi:hypothetical protein
LSQAVARWDAALAPVIGCCRRERICAMRRIRCTRARPRRPGRRATGQLDAQFRRGSAAPVSPHPRRTACAARAVEAGTRCSIPPPIWRRGFPREQTPSRLPRGVRLGAARPAAAR